MRLKRYFWQIYSNQLLISLGIVLVFFLIARYSIQTFYYAETGKGLHSKLSLVTKEIKSRLSENDSDGLDEWVKQKGASAQTRFTVILPNGVVLADSDYDPHKMDNHASRPEVIQAFKGNRGHSIRPSATLRMDLFYVAIPLYENQRILGVLRAAVPSEALKNTLFKLDMQVLAGGFVLVLIVASASWIFSRRISQPLEYMKSQAQKFANGDLSGRINLGPKSPLELVQLGDSLNEMVNQLESRIGSLDRERSMQETVFSSMIEGVLSINNQAQILKMNKVAKQILNVSKEVDLKYKKIDAIVKDEDLLSIIVEGLRSDEIVEADLELDGHVYLQIHSTPLINASGERIGVLIVLNDVTQLTKLQKHRKRFVANVSHELRTPLTSIKGFVETLLDGAIEDEGTTRKFLGIILKQVNRLSTLIESLLTLSKMDREEMSIGDAHQELERVDVKIRPLLESAVQICSHKADKKLIPLVIDCDEDVKWQVNPSLLEQALVSLIDNAVSYCDESKPVKVSAQKKLDELVLSVQDQGPGIPEKHHHKIFERFYRVDKGRSRYKGQGGTGLGLAIVKHIARAHGGEVFVKSRPGEGSEFFINLPKIKMISTKQA